MSISLFDLFSIGIGPSSSHTVGPMLAANAFLHSLVSKNFIHSVSRIKVELYGSLALTGKGHGTDKAVLNGLEGQKPDTVIPESMVPCMQDIIKSGKLHLAGMRDISWNNDKDLLFLQKELLPRHSNGMRFTAFDAEGKSLLTEVWYSIGGGFIVNEENFDAPVSDRAAAPWPFATAFEMISRCKENNFTILSRQNDNVPLSPK